jgi:hypothetical protein
MARCVHFHSEVATPIPCKLDQRVPKSQINTKVSKNTQQAQLRTRRMTVIIRTMENPPMNSSFRLKRMSPETFFAFTGKAE